MSGSFRFRQFTIHQNDVAQKVGTDSVLLGAWITHSHTEKILDIGCGTGILALMMAQKFRDAKVDAVEAEQTAAICASKNVSASPFKDRITIFKGLFQDFNPDQTYDLIVTNPPFFSNGLLPKDQKRRIARHNSNLTQQELISISHHLLSTDGVLCLILPFDEAYFFLKKAEGHGFSISRICHVIPIPGKLPNRVLMAFKKEKCKQYKSEKMILRNENRTYTNDFKKLTTDFYLHL